VKETEKRTTRGSNPKGKLRGRRREMEKITSEQTTNVFIMRRKKFLILSGKEK